MRLQSVQRNSSGTTNLSLLIYLLATLAVWFSMASTKASTVADTQLRVEASALAENDLTNSLEEIDGSGLVLHEFTATAYCLTGQTASGIEVQPGVVAADPDVLPIGSVVRLHAGRYSGVYVVLDTGLKVRGRMVDVWIPDFDEAIEFGVRRVKLQVLRLGWK
jgi:3D (Asp-Asp-Asp) domain-containing protein